MGVIVSLSEIQAWQLHQFLARLGDDPHNMETSLRELATRWIEVECHGERDGMSFERATGVMAGIAESMLVMISHVPGVASPLIVRTALIKEAETAEMLRDA